MKKKILCVIICMMLFSSVLLSTINKIDVTEEKIDAKDMKGSVLQSEGDDDWPMFQHDAGHTGFSLSTGPNTNTSLWDRYTLGQSSPVVVDNKIYTSGPSALVCHNAINGDMNWLYESAVSTRAPAVYDDRIYMTNNSHVLCINPSGGFEWSQYIGNTNGLGSVAVENDKVFAIADTNITCVSTSNHQILWVNSTGTIDNPITTEPAVADNNIYVAAGRKVFCYNAGNGDLLWEKTVLPDELGEQFFLGAVTVADNNVYVVSFTGVLYCLDANDGDENWNNTISYGIDVSPAIAYGNVYIGSLSEVKCLDVTDEAEVWKYSTEDNIYCSPAVADNKVYIATSGKLLCLNAEGNGDGTTSLIWEYTSAPSIKYIAISGGILYVSASNVIYAFGDNEAPETPTISAPTNNIKNEPVPFTVYTTDPDGDDVYYYFQWKGQGGGISDLYGPYPSGEEVVITHTYPDIGADSETYDVRVRAKDPYGTKSSRWSDPWTIYIVSEQQLIISAPSYVLMGTEFDVTISANGELVNSVSVEFNDHVFDTNENGIVTFEAPAVDTTTEFTITASKDDYLSATATIMVNDRSQLVIAAPFSVTAGNKFEVTITANNDAVEGVDVTFNDDTVSTDENGDVSFFAPEVDSETDYTIEANKEDYESAIEIITVEPKVGYCYGIVTDSDGLPIENANICVTPEGSSTSDCMTYTNINGEYYVMKPKGNYLFRASKQGYELSERNVVVYEDTAEELNFVLKKMDSSEIETTVETEIIEYTIKSQIDAEKIGVRIDVEEDANDIQKYNSVIDVEIIESTNKEFKFSVRADDTTPNQIIVITFGRGTLADLEKIKVSYDDKMIIKVGFNELFNPDSEEDSATWTSVLAYDTSGEPMLFILINTHFSEHTITIFSMVEAIGGITAVILYVFICAVVFFVFLSPMITNIIRRRMQLKKK